MATILVDPGMTFLSGGTVEPVTVWATLTNGERRDTGEQQRDEQGRHKWRVTAIVPAVADGDRPDLIEVMVLAADEPKVPPAGEPVTFDRLRARPSLHRASGTLRTYWDADGVRARGGRPAPAPQS